jgi:hypothetical protein
VPGSVDTGTILTFVGFILAVVAVTFGLVAVLAQHLAETYSRAIANVFERAALWRVTAVFEGMSLVLVAALALWRPT